MVGVQSGLLVIESRFADPRWVLGSSGGVSADRMPTTTNSAQLQNAVVALWVGAFVIGTVCHLLDIANGGWLPYKGYALGLNVFWTALTVFDPLAVVLLVYRRRAGVYLALFIISVDVLVNLTVGVGEFMQNGRFTFWGLYTQVPVGVFMWLTAPMLLRSGRQGQALDTCGT